MSGILLHYRRIRIRLECLIKVSRAITHIYIYTTTLQSMEDPVFPYDTPPNFPITGLKFLICNFFLSNVFFYLFQASLPMSANSSSLNFPLKIFLVLLSSDILIKWFSRCIRLALRVFILCFLIIKVFNHQISSISSYIAIFHGFTNLPRDLPFPCNE